MIEITKEMLKIPESLDKYYLSLGWFEDYWRDLPLNWNEWTTKELQKYPILLPIIEWKKSHPGGE